MYLDHILVFSQNHTDYTHHVQQVLQWLLENCLFIKVEKCEFYARSVTFIESGCVKVDREKIQAVVEWPRPTTLKQFERWFLGFANFYRHFIRDISWVAAPLTRLTSTPFVWTPEAEAAFNKLKKLFTSAYMLI